MLKSTYQPSLQPFTQATLEIACPHNSTKTFSCFQFHIQSTILMLFSPVLPNKTKELQFCTSIMSQNMSWFYIDINLIVNLRQKVPSPDCKQLNRNKRKMCQMISVVQHVHFRINAGNLLGARETNRKGRSTLKARNALTSNP